MSKSRGTQSIAGHEEVAQRLRRLAETRDQIPPRALAAELYEEISYALLHGVRWEEITQAAGASSMRGLQNAYYRVRKARGRARSAASNRAPAPTPPPPPQPPPSPHAAQGQGTPQKPRPRRRLKLPEPPRFDFSQGVVTANPDDAKNLNIK